jgi:hypothetical protein
LHDFRLSRGVTRLEPTLTVELTYSELMEAGCAIRSIAATSLPDSAASDLRSWLTLNGTLR